MDKLKMLKLRRERLIYLREVRGWRSWKDLAAAAGMDVQVLSRLINARSLDGVRMGTVGKLCTALSSADSRVDLDDLVERVPD